MARSSLKPVTLRLPEEDLRHVQREAEQLGVSVGVYLRMLVRQSMRHQPDVGGFRRAHALKRLSNAMAAEASEKGYTEEDVARLSKEARRHLVSKEGETQRND